MSANGTPRVVVVGDVIDDIIVRPEGPIVPDTDTPSTIERRLGGSAANTACWLAAEGLDVTFVGTVHHDDVDRHALALTSSGVTPHLTGSDLPTGSIVLLVDGAVRTMLTSRGANVETGPDRVTDQILEGARHLHLTGYSFFGEDRDGAWRALLARAGAAGLTRSVDPSSRSFLDGFGIDRFLGIVAGTEALLPSLDEATLLAGTDSVDAAAQWLHERFPVVVVKSGADGATAIEHGTAHRVAAVPARATDVTGAGDAFDAGFLAGVLRGSGVRRALEHAASVAAAAVQTVGARPVSSRTSISPGKIHVYQTDA